RYLLCNADEGEPGTFKDRLIMEGDPHRLIEGMILAGYAIGAEKGYIYIRGEYTDPIERMGRAIVAAREAGFLGEGILGSSISFDIEVKRGAGSYVCGEETAMIESIEGKRGYPRLKPPYPGSSGLWGKPTVVNNVETLANVPPIVNRGADWFRSFGTETSPGTKVFPIFGAVNEPKAVEVEMGTHLSDLIELAGGIRDGSRFKAALIGGAAGAFLGPDGLDVRLDFEGPKDRGGVLGSGAILVIDDGSSIPEILHVILRFFEHESCGQCAPCRAGTASIVRLSERVLTGSGRASDLDLILDLAETMEASSFCPLGQSVILSVRSALTLFPDEFLSCLKEPHAIAYD
ncbi:NADP oxidoreductase, partial [Candidatus Acetothermia bacterium]